MSFLLSLHLSLLTSLPHASARHSVWSPPPLTKLCECECEIDWVNRHKLESIIRQNLLSHQLATTRAATATTYHISHLTHITFTSHPSHIHHRPQLPNSLSEIQLTTRMTRDSGSHLSSSVKAHSNNYNYSNTHNINSHNNFHFLCKLNHSCSLFLQVILISGVVIAVFIGRSLLMLSRERLRHPASSLHNNAMHHGNPCEKCFDGDFLCATRSDGRRGRERERQVETWAHLSGFRSVSLFILAITQRASFPPASLFHPCRIYFFLSLAPSLAVNYSSVSYWVQLSFVSPRFNSGSCSQWGEYRAAWESADGRRCNPLL